MIEELLRPPFKTKDLNDLYDLEIVREDVLWVSIIAKVCVVCLIKLVFIMIIGDKTKRELSDYMLVMLRFHTFPRQFVYAMLVMECSTCDRQRFTMLSDE